MGITLRTVRARPFRFLVAGPWPLDKIWTIRLGGERGPGDQHRENGGNTVRKYIGSERAAAGGEQAAAAARDGARGASSGGVAGPVVSRRTTAKQRLTATRLHRQLREEGYEVGITTVRSYVREWKRQRQENLSAAVRRRVGGERQLTVPGHTS